MVTKVAVDVGRMVVFIVVVVVVVAVVVVAVMSLDGRCCSSG